MSASNDNDRDGGGKIGQLLLDSKITENELTPDEFRQIVSVFMRLKSWRDESTQMGIFRTCLNND